MHSCHIPRPPRPPLPAPAPGYLMQKIIAFEKRSLPGLCTEWCFDSCVSGCIQQVSASGAPGWTLENGGTLRITIPVQVRICDACGHCRICPAVIEAETCMPHSFLCGMEDVRNTLLILPCIQLLGAENICAGCYRVKLAVSLEIFLLRYETLCCGPMKPPCPQLPLYPPPMC